MGLLSRQLELLAERRAALCDEIAEIDRKLASVAKAIGVDLSEAAPDPVGPPLAKREHPGSKGSMAQYIRDFFREADRGYTRKELKEIVRKVNAKFEESISRNENGFYNAVKRAISANDIAEIDGVLYDFSRAPSGENTQSLFPSNVSILKTTTDQ